MSGARDAAVLAGFVASLLGVLLTPWCTRDRVPEPARWVEAVRAHKESIEPGTLVLVHPPWREDVARAIAASDVLPAGARVTTTIAPRSTEALDRMLILSEEGGVPLPANLRRARSVGAVGGIAVELLDAPRRNTGTNLLDALASARVEVALPDRTVACTWDAAAARHVCGDLAEWMHVGMEKLQVGGAWTSCAWAHPITDGTLSITFDGALARTPLTFGLALADGAADNAQGAPVTAAVSIDGTEVARVTRQGERGFGRAQIAGRADARELRITLTTPQDGQRHTCFTLTRGDGT